MASTMDFQEESGISIAMKNTFLYIKRTAEDTVRRSSSVPCTFKPRSSAAACSASSTIDQLETVDVSTNASDKDATENSQIDSPRPSGDSEQDTEDFPDATFDDSFDCCSNCTDDSLDFDARPRATISRDRSAESQIPDEPQQSRVTLSLCNMVTAQSEKVRTKLKTHAKPFNPAPKLKTLPAEVMLMVSNAVEVMSSGYGISNVVVQDGGICGTTIIEARCTNKANLSILTLVKNSLLESAGNSEKTYVLGYGAQPFTDIDASSFSANIACMPAAHQDSACWDTYTKGFCPRCASCRWDHPSAMDQMRIICKIRMGA